MGKVGSYLRNAREARGIDLRDAAQQTRISINYLKAIEDEDFSKLPGEVFVKGFLKNYARFLHLPEDEVVRLYGERSMPQQVASPPAAPAAPATDSQKQRPPEMGEARAEVKQPGGLSIEPFLWGGVILIGMALFILVALPASRPAHKPDSRVSTQLTSTDSLPKGMTGTGKAEKLYLGIIAQDDVWVLVRTDASPQKKAVLKKGESMTWSADERFLLSYASVGSLKLSLNGNELTVNGPKNAVVRDLIVTAKGIANQKIESEQPPRPRKPKALSQTTSTATSTAQPTVQETQPTPAVIESPPQPVKPLEPLVNPVEPPVSSHD
jgi:transcriptional regulator with XRE-family HTH domain